MNGIDPGQLLYCVIDPVVARLGVGSNASARALLLGTVAQESGFVYLKQLGAGPALGLWQMEPATHDDLWANFLEFQLLLRNKALALRATEPSATAQLATNLAYACACARLQYLRAPSAIPGADDVAGLAAYWKTWWNTPKGAGTTGQFLANWDRFKLTDVLKQGGR